MDLNLSLAVEKSPGWVTGTGFERLWRREGFEAPLRAAVRCGRSHGLARFAGIRSAFPQLRTFAGFEFLIRCRKKARIPKERRLGIHHGGERGIRTLETLTRPTVFKTAAFNRSAISPW